MISIWMLESGDISWDLAFEAKNLIENVFREKINPFVKEKLIHKEFVQP